MKTRILIIPSKAALFAAALMAFSAPGSAGPWMQAGDAQQRSDIDLLAAAGVIDNITMEWPLPWGGVLNRLEANGALSEQPDFIRDIAQRVTSRGISETQTHVLHASATVDAASAPNTIRAFDALGRESVQGQVSAEYVWSSTAVNLAVGAQTVDRHDKQVLVLDGSYIAQRIGNAGIYAGYVTHWWGPGWISAMSLSNNARPVPQIGITRISTTPFDSPWLSWIGPWQAEFFVGVLDGPRKARNTIYDGFRLAFSPIRHLEIALSRTDMMCGTGHTCKPLVGYFSLSNQDNDVNIVNDQGSIDIRYSGLLGKWGYEIFTQAMNEDTNPFVHSGTSHLFGGSLWRPIYGGIGRFTVEYADSVATRDLWGSGIYHGVAYNNWQYTDGMRYRDRTLGFSLDSDSRLFSIQTSFTDSHARSFTLTYHRANISNPLNTNLNAVTTSPVKFNQVQGRVSLPFELSHQRLRFDIEGRYQSDQPRPRKGSLATIELAVTAGL